jgi:hypothetical protein
MNFKYTEINRKYGKLNYFIHIGLPSSLEVTTSNRIFTRSFG